MDKICPICSNIAPFRLKKGSTYYNQCSSCKTLFSDPLENSDMVGGGNEVQRNELQNHERISRIAELSLGMKKESLFVCDFGCGHQYLVNDLRGAGYINTIGYDAYNQECNRLPEKNKYHIVTCIEVIEHTSFPFVEIDVIVRSLLPGGVIIIETSFVDIAAEDSIPLDEFFYIEPSVGHSTIFSHHGLDLVMALKGMIPRQHCNRNVRVYQKPFVK